MIQGSDMNRSSDMTQSSGVIKATDFLDLDWLDHGFGLRDSVLPDDIRTVKQIHSSIVLEAADRTNDDISPQTGDALLTDRPGVRVGVKTADCVPILLVDP